MSALTREIDGTNHSEPVPPFPVIHNPRPIVPCEATWYTHETNKSSVPRLDRFRLGIFGIDESTNNLADQQWANALISEAHCSTLSTETNSHILYKGTTRVVRSCPC